MLKPYQLARALMFKEAMNPGSGFHVRVLRGLADHCMRPAVQHFAEWQRHKRNANIQMAQDHEQMMWVRLLDWADFNEKADAELSRIQRP